MDLIQLHLPNKKEYVKIARLTAASIASNLGFDVEEMEDIKVAVGEAINIAFKLENHNFKNIFIVFKVSEGEIEIETTYPACLQEEIQSEEGADLSFIILKSLMDDVHVVCDGGSSKLFMKKKVGV